MSTSSNLKANRRAFFLRGGALVGAGLASTSAVAAPFALQSSTSLRAEVASLRSQLALLGDIDAIRLLQETFVELAEKHGLIAFQGLFTHDADMTFSKAHDGIDVESAFTAMRYTTPVSDGRIEFGADGQEAVTEHSCEIQISVPHAGPFALTEMARLQGHYASNTWKAGKVIMRYRKAQGEWKISSLELL